MADGATKSKQHAEVERIVRRVLAELTALEANDRPAAGGELALAAKVVSLAELEGRVDGISRVVVSRGAVFTPAARDELRKRQIAIASDASHAPAGPTKQLLIGIAETNYELTALENMLTSEGIKIQRQGAKDLIAAVDGIGDHVATRGCLGLLLTGNPAAAVCLANRRAGVRAALGHGVQTVADAVRGVAVNLLVVDPNGRNLFEMRQMARTLVRAGNKPCPPALGQRLG